MRGYAVGDLLKRGRKTGQVYLIVDRNPGGFVLLGLRSGKTCQRYPSILRYSYHRVRLEDLPKAELTAFMRRHMEDAP